MTQYFLNLISIYDNLRIEFRLFRINETCRQPSNTLEYNWPDVRIIRIAQPRLFSAFKKIDCESGGKDSLKSRNRAGCGKRIQKLISLFNKSALCWRAVFKRARRNVFFALSSLLDEKDIAVFFNRNSIVLSALKVFLNNPKDGV